MSIRCKNKFINIFIDDDREILTLRKHRYSEKNPNSRLLYHYKQEWFYPFDIVLMLQHGTKNVYLNLVDVKFM